MPPAAARAPRDPQSPVVLQCRRIQNELLGTEAPRLLQHFAKLEIEPQVCAGQCLRASLRFAFCILFIYLFVYLRFVFFCFFVSLFIYWCFYLFVSFYYCIIFVVFCIFIYLLVYLFIYVVLLLYSFRFVLSKTGSRRTLPLPTALPPPRCSSSRPRPRHAPARPASRAHRWPSRAQVYAMKWLRLLFLRDFQLEDSLMVWDAVFADVRHTGTLSTLVPWLGVVMLLYMEQDLLASGEYEYCIKRLMKFPHVQVVMPIRTGRPAWPQGCIGREGASEAAPEAVRQAVGGGC